ncbi:hypothetical protein B0H13DRAFT_1916240 [Mycena leptocephala]|nr:hypothetical protein B0H13DRAFT_1916240 [Mycena leptocephala]
MYTLDVVHYHSNSIFEYPGFRSARRYETSNKYIDKQAQGHAVPACKSQSETVAAGEIQAGDRAPTHRQEADGAVVRQQQCERCGPPHSAAATIKVLSLFWNSTKEHDLMAIGQPTFYDFNLPNELVQRCLSAVTFYPVRSNTIPPAVLTSSICCTTTKTERSLQRTSRWGCSGASLPYQSRPSTNVLTLVHRDVPNMWLLRMPPPNVTKGALPTPSTSAGSISLISKGQLGMLESALLVQNLTRLESSGVVNDVEGRDSLWRFLRAWAWVPCTPCAPASALGLPYKAENQKHQ